MLKFARRYKPTVSIDKIIPIKARLSIINYKQAKEYTKQNPDKTLKEMFKVLKAKDGAR